MNKIKCLSDAIEITKEYARSASPKDYTAIANMLKSTYTMLKELSQDANN